MTILVTGGTGNIGSQVVAQLASRGFPVKVLTRAPDKAQLPAGAVAVKGDLIDVDAMRSALDGVSTLFLLAATGAEEMNQALVTLNVAREAGITRLVYLSVYKGENFGNIPHFTSKYTVERMIGQAGFASTILRPSYFMQNDVRLKNALLDGGLYPQPIGGTGIAMIDTRDIAETAALELIRREKSATELPSTIIDLVGPNAITGDTAATIWGEVLKRPIRYGGDALDPMEQQLRAFAPAWAAYDLRLMMSRYQKDGALAEPGAIARLTQALGKAPRSYKAFAAETAARWQAAAAA